MLLAGERNMEGAPFDEISFDLCSRRKDVIVMSADLSRYTDLFRVPRELPDQYLDVGMAEQNLMSVGAGVSKAGFVPVATTFACYASRRAFDQMVICMGTGPRTCVVIGFMPGITCPARIHHQSTEDLGMVRAVPNATVIDPMDPIDFRQALEAAVDIPGLVYMRGHRGATPRILDPEKFKFELGQDLSTPSRQRRRCHRHRACDSMGARGFGFARRTRFSGIRSSHVPTIKPVDETEIAEFLLCA